MNPGRRTLFPTERRVIGVGATMLLHVAIILGWQATRRAALPDDGVPAAYLQWLRLAPDMPVASSPDPAPIVKSSPRVPTRRAPDRPAVADEPVSNPATAPAAITLPAAGAQQILEQARREAGDIDRALRKKSNPYIVAPPDSPQIRMAQKFREAAALAPNRLWEAPKVVELVNDGGDGARRTRVITAAGIYCITERAPTTSIDVIEKFGKQRITNCGHEHEQPANPQQWRTARD